MLITLIKKDKILNFTLPMEIRGNYWIKDKDANGKERNLINVEATDNSWILKSNLETQIFFNGKYCEKITAVIGNFYSLNVFNSNEKIMLYIRNVIDTSNISYEIVEKNDITIKDSEDAFIVYSPNFKENLDVTLYYQNDKCFVKNNNLNLPIYKNKEAVTDELLAVGDTLFIYGLVITYMGSFLIINNPANNVKIKGTGLKVKEKQQYPSLLIKEDEYAVAYNPNEFFSVLPRFREKIEVENIVIDAPPAKAEPKDQPLLLTIGPMLTMGIVSLVSLISALNAIIVEGQSVADQLSSLIISISMLASMVLWPMISASYEKKHAKKEEKKRQERYSKYLTTKEKEIEDICIKQKRIMEKNYVDATSIITTFAKSKEHLWEKNVKDDDFLELRIGMGNMKPKIKVNYPEEHFSLYEDNLKDILYHIIDKNQIIKSVPKTINLTEKRLLSILGDKKSNREFINNLILQTAYFNSYAELKIVYFTDGGDKEELKYLKTLPHNYNDDRSIRFYASNIDQMRDVSNYINNILYSRKEEDNNNSQNVDSYKKYKDYYLIITDNIKASKNTNLIKGLLDTNVNYGFSLIILNENLNEIPEECETFIELNKEQNNAKILEANTKEDEFSSFVPDYCNYDLHPVFQKMMNIPLEVESVAKKLPTVLKFLEMYKCGNVKQLNILNRWKNSDATVSLRVPIGVDTSGELFTLDLHEKYHGPHGLVAGMTGSGKSEFLISYILSLAINFHPDDVSFVIIDYKGGGLSGAFENKITGEKLPHLAGSITNLDTIEMNRALASIESELKRRQKVFNIAREKTGESTIDIYKYQNLYKQGLVDEPVSHLLIISDEFAELKLQQPDFMDELISTARIGRSLGVHLILATQKPSGVVDDQIWSNSKFRICLKVQEKSDSMDMIKTEEAATLVDPGRFYLQVGYNEYFALGQSAWCGGAYYPSEELKKEVDNSVVFVDETAKTIYKLKDDKEEVIKSQGEELPSILKHIIEVAKNENVQAKKLWLDKVPDIIYVDDLKEKYKFVPEKFNINPIIGEYDDPSTQSQHPLTLGLSELGNTIIVGTADSGEELMLKTIVYSTITNYSVMEANFFILDFGSETMKVFKEAPHVGDIITSEEKEKIINLFKMLNEMIEGRKVMLQEYNGDFKLFNASSDKKLANVIVIINNYEAFSELYDEFEDELISLSRESIKYGIYFISTISSINGMRYKISQNFKQYICLKLNDEGDYRSLFSNPDKVYPSNIFGRGIINKDKVYEFQTAWPCEEEKLNDYVKKVSLEIKEKEVHHAHKVPVLPERLLLSEVLKDDYTLLPVGMNKDTLELEKVDVYKYGMYLVTGEDVDAINDFALTLPKLIHHTYRMKPIILDAGRVFGEGENIYKDNFDKVIDAFIKYEKKLIVLVTGIKKVLEFKEKLSEVDFEKIHFILIDTIGEIKDLSFEKIIKDNTSFSNALWVGEGIDSQFTIKVNGRLPRINLDYDFSYLIRNGRANVIKIIEEGVKDE